MRDSQLSGPSCSWLRPVVKSAITSLLGGVSGARAGVECLAWFSVLVSLLASSAERPSQLGLSAVLFLGSEFLRLTHEELLKGFGVQAFGSRVRILTEVARLR